MLPSVRRCVGAVALFLAVLAPARAGAQPIPGCEGPSPLPGGSFSLICVPPPGVWNGQLVVFAHGYVAPGPVPDFQFPVVNGVPLPALVQSLGYAFAATTYRRNGLAILQGVEDVRLLVEAFSASDTHPPPTRTHLIGVSEGGLVATLLAERSPEAFTSAIAACAPIGNFRLQLNYIGDFRVLFDYFFPGLLPGTAIDIPQQLIDDWDSVYAPRVIAALVAYPGRALELMRVSRAAFDPANLSTVILTTLNILRYNVTATNDAKGQLGGNPFGNRLTLYLGSSNDLRLNLLVRRFSASPVALASLRAYETNGNLRIPLVTLHTTADDLIPFAHEFLYLPKVDLSERGRFIPLPVQRYGHCTFTAEELLGTFALATSLP